MGRRWWLSAALLAIGVAGMLGHGRTLASRAVSQQRDVALMYLVRVPQLPAGAQEVRLWIPLAKTGAEQVIHQRTIQAPVPYTVESEPVYGNDLVHLVLTPPFPDDVRVAIDYQVSLRSSHASLGAEPTLTPAQRLRYAAAEGLVAIDEEVRGRARLATAGRAAPQERARGIYDHVIAHMVYDKETPGWGRGDTKRACLLGKGNCTDFHSLFMSMARAEGIPARFKIGVVIPQDAAGMLSGYHCWAEFYEAGHGWVSVDASEAWKHPELTDHYFGSWDANRFLISTGRNLELVPRQAGGPVNILFYPYVEVNGEPLTGVETEL
ncbi:MAG: transglutaminase-like domain-containing protein, partial [candidate division NC10 bacterium]